MTLLAMLALVAVAGSVGMIPAAHRTVGTIGRVEEVTPVLSPVNPNVENYLLVGSDSRANADPTSPDAGGIGSATDVTGSRSDTIMILRLDKSNDSASTCRSRVTCGS